MDRPNPLRKPPLRGYDRDLTILRALVAVHLQRSETRAKQATTAPELEVTVQSRRQRNS